MNATFLSEKLLSGIHHCFQTALVHPVTAYCEDDSPCKITATAKSESESNFHER